MQKKNVLVNILVYLCITFFVMTLVFIYMSLRGKPQAGLIEVICSASLFVIFLHVIKKVLPDSVNVIVSVLSVLMAIFFVYSNFHLQRMENKDYTTREIFVGDLLVRKFFGNNERSRNLPAKSFENIESIEFSKTTTEKYTIESSFEKSKEIILGNNTINIPLDVPVESSINIVKEEPFDSPGKVPVYELKLKRSEPPSQDKNGDKMVVIENMITDHVLPQHLEQAVFPTISVEADQLNYILDSRDQISDLMSTISSSHMPLEESFHSLIGNQNKNKLEKP